MKYNELKSSKISNKKSKRVGRGAGSGLEKLQEGELKVKNQDRVSINGFEGGQMPLYRRLPKEFQKSI